MGKGYWQRDTIGLVIIFNKDQYDGFNKYQCFKGLLYREMLCADVELWVCKFIAGSMGATLRT
jgi:hypothetical protein